jgi:Ni,Fe-hydrogenase I small subunit
MVAPSFVCSCKSSPPLTTTVGVADNKTISGPLLINMQYCPATPPVIVDIVVETLVVSVNVAADGGMLSVPLDTYVPL